MIDNSVHTENQKDRTDIDLSSSSIFEDPSKSNQTKESFSKLTEIALEIIPGINTEEKSAYITSLASRVSDILDIPSEEFIKDPNCARYIEQQIYFESNMDLLGKQMALWNADENNLGSIFSKYMTSLRDLSFRSGRIVSESNTEGVISDQNLTTSYELRGTYRTALKDKTNTNNRVSPHIVKAITNSSLDTSIIEDLLGLSHGGFVTSLSQRELLAPDNSYNHDKELQLSGFYRSIKWQEVPGKNPTVKVIKFIKKLDELLKVNNQHVLDRKTSQQVLSSIRAERLLNNRNSFGANIDYKEDLSSILERSYKLRKTVRTIPAVNSPFLGEFGARSIAQDANVRINDITLVYDLWNLVHGADITPDDIWIPFLKKTLQEKGLSQNEIELQIEYQKKLTQILQNIDWSKINGRNNREKVKISLQLLATNTSNNIDIRISSSNVEQTFDLEDAISRVQDPRLHSETLVTAINAANKMDPIERDLLLEAIGMRDSAGSGHADQLSTRLIAHHLLTSPLIREIDKFAKILNETPQFNHKRPRNDKSTGIPPWKEVREIDSLEQLRELVPSNLLIGSDKEDLLVPMITSGSALGLLEATQKIKHDAGTKFQLLYLLIDSSGSMDSLSRIGAACAILNNRLVAVAKNEAHLFYRFFDSQPFTVTEVRTKTEASKALSHVMRYNYAGGGTNFNNALTTSVREIRQMLSTRQDLIAPQITMITDGGDSVSLRSEDLLGMILNVILVDGTTNPQLCALAKSTGGTIIRISRSGQILEIQ